MNNDQTTTIEELRQAVRSFVHARRWQPYHTPGNLAMSISIEAAELLEHFQWQSALNTPSEEQHAVADELADILIYCLSFANACDIDISQAVFQKLEINQTRFPAP